MRTVWLWITAPVVIWVLIYWKTDDPMFAFWMTLIPVSWACIHIHELYDATIRKHFHACASRFLSRPPRTETD